MKAMTLPFVNQVVGIVASILITPPLSVQRLSGNLQSYRHDARDNKK
jgi:hypothetical protein